MDKFSFRNWLVEYGDIYWEGLRDISALPLDQIDLNKVPEEEDDDFEEEGFDEDDASNDCWNDDSRDLSDYSDETIYDDIDDDPDFDQESPEDWDESNPEPSRDKFDTDEEYNDAFEKWEGERSDVEYDYDHAVRKWEINMSEVKSRAESARENSRDEELSDCVEEKRKEHEEEQERRREEHERVKSEAPSGNYESNFKIGEDNFKVEIQRDRNISFNDEKLTGVFDIYFQGPNSYQLTGKNTASEASVRYKYLLASVAKMVQTETDEGNPVNGFTFSAAQEAMNLMYNKFYKDYLQPNGYLRVEKTVYLKKDYIREILSGSADYSKKYAYKKILSTNTEVQSLLKKIKEKKAIDRQAKKIIPTLFGKIISYKTWQGATIERPGFVLGISPGHEPLVKVAIINGSNEATWTNLKLTDIQDKQPPQEEVIKLLTAMDKNRHLVDAVTIQPFRQLLAHYGLGNYGIEQTRIAHSQMGQQAIGQAIDNKTNQLAPSVS